MCRLSRAGTLLMNEKKLPLDVCDTNQCLTSECKITKSFRNCKFFEIKYR